MIRFSEEAWGRTRRLREAIHRLPFNTELAAGSLARDRFQGYIIQDSLYLGRFSRALAIAAARAPDTDAMQSFAESALRAVAVEQALHGRYLREFGIDPARIGEAEASPDCLAYTSYLIATAYHEPWEVLVAALLPCFRIYWTSGAKSRKRQRPRTPIGRGSTLMPTSALAKPCKPPFRRAIGLPPRSPWRRERRCWRRSCALANTNGCFGTVLTSAGTGPLSTEGAGS